MRNYIIKQLNLEPDRIKNLNIIQKEDGTDFYVELVHSFPECPYCGGNTISNGHGRPKPINHPTIVDEHNRIIFVPLDLHLSVLTSAFPKSKISYKKDEKLDFSSISSYIRPRKTLKRHFLKPRTILHYPYIQHIDHTYILP